MKKLVVSLFAFFFVLGMLAGCNSSNAPATQTKEQKDKQVTEQKTKTAAFPVTIKDATGKDVTIDKKPERIVSLIPSNTEAAFALGLDKEIVGVSDFDNYPKEAAQKQKIGGMEFNIEKVISLKPDLVLAHASTASNSKQGLQQLTDAGIKVVVVNDAENFDQVYDSITMIGKATGQNKQAAKVIQDMKDRLKKLQTQASKIAEKDEKTVFVEVSPAPEIYTSGKNTFIDQMLSILHAKNAASDLTGWAKITNEAIIKKNPDVIVTTYGFYVKDPVGQVVHRQGWQDVKAIKTKQVTDVNSDLVTRPGPRLVEGVEELAKAVYPDVFKK
jgi:iron complex transport system substrate-binding protein